MSLYGTDALTGRISNVYTLTEYSWAHAYLTKSEAIDDIVRKKLMTKAEILTQLVTISDQMKELI